MTEQTVMTAGLTGNRAHSRRGAAFSSVSDHLFSALSHLVSVLSHLSSHLSSLLPTPPLRHRVAVAVALVSLGSGPVLAHDMWIEPLRFTTEVGDIVPLRLRVGEALLGDPLVRDARLVRDFVVVDGEGRRPVVGRDGSDPAGLIRAAAPGLLVVGYHSTASHVDMTADKFNQYLREEGLDAIAARRAAQHMTDRGARDAFVRCAKTLVLAGAPTTTHGDRPLGLPLELVAERNPYALGASQELPVRLTFEQRPLPGVLVVAFNKRNPADRQLQRTDNDGRVRFRIASGGTWLVKAVHMVEAAPGADADVQSYWASLTFAPAPGGPPAAAATR